MKKRNIFIDIRPLIPRNRSGVAHYVAQLLKELDTMLDEPEVNRASLSYKLIVPFRARNMIEQRYEFSNLKLVPIFLQFRVMNLLIRKNLMPPLDIFFGPGTYVFPAFVRPPLLFSQSVVFLYDTAYTRFPESLDQKTLALLTKKVPIALKRSKIVTISDATKYELEEIHPSVRSRTTVIRPSVDTRSFYRRSDDEIIVRKNIYDLSGAYILCVGNLEPRKNIMSLVKAYVALSDSLRDKYSLVIIGADTWNSQKDIEEIQAYKEAGYKITVLLKTVSDDALPALYSGASLFVFPSLYEGYGIPPIEAMACGVPVIASSSPAIKEAVGDAALIIKDQMDTNEIADKITKVLGNPQLQEELVNKGYTHVDSLPSWREAALKFNEIFQRAVKEQFKK